MSLAQLLLSAARRSAFVRGLGAGVALLVALGTTAAGAALPSSASRAELPPLDGESLDFEHDARPLGHPERSWLARAFVHRLVAAEPARPRPVVVFLHGINAQLIKYRWMGGGREGDVRRVVAGLMESGAIEPVIVAAPSAVLPAATANARTSWPAFDLGEFVQLLELAVSGRATVDPSRVIVVGHSGAGCNPRGGIASAARGSLRPSAVMAVDACMDPEVGIALARAAPETRIIVTWQTQGWLNRPFDLFVKAFRRENEGEHRAAADARVLDHLRVTEPMPHDAILPLTLRKWLPELVAAPSTSPPSP